MELPTLMQFEFKESRLEPGSFHHAVFYVDRRFQDPGAARSLLGAWGRGFLEALAGCGLGEPVGDVFVRGEAQQAVAAALTGRGLRVRAFHNDLRKDVFGIGFRDPGIGLMVDGPGTAGALLEEAQAGTLAEFYLRWPSSARPLPADPPGWLHPGLEHYLNHRGEFAFCAGFMAEPFHLYVFADEHFHTVLDRYRLWLRPRVKLLDGRP